MAIILPCVLGRVQGVEASVVLTMTLTGISPAVWLRGEEASGCFGCGAVCPGLGGWGVSGVNGGGGDRCQRGCLRVYTAWAEEGVSIWVEAGVRLH